MQVWWGGRSEDLLVLSSVSFLYTFKLGDVCTGGCLYECKAIKNSVYTTDINQYDSVSSMQLCADVVREASCGLGSVTQLRGGLWVQGVYSCSGCPSVHLSDMIFLGSNCHNLETVLLAPSHFLYWFQDLYKNKQTADTLHSSEESEYTPKQFKSSEFQILFVFWSAPGFAQTLLPVASHYTCFHLLIPEGKAQGSTLTVMTSCVFFT